MFTKIRKLWIAYFILFGFIYSGSAIFSDQGNYSIEEVLFDEEMKQILVLPDYAPPEYFSKELLTFIDYHCMMNGVPKELFYNLIKEESGWNIKAFNKKSKDYGLAQLNNEYIIYFVWKFGYEKDIEFKPRTNPYHNVLLGIRYFASLVKQTGSFRGAVISYNCGFTKYSKNKIPKDTLDYANRIIPFDNWWLLVES